MFTTIANKIFNRVIDDYHQHDEVTASMENPYEANTIKALLYQKCWIDTVQWHLEDIIREPTISPERALQIKRKIDASNQERTDVVELIDRYFLIKFQEVDVKKTATINTESPAWAIDRLSILALKIYHMAQETLRADADNEHIQRCEEKLFILKQQQKDLSLAIDQLLEDMKNGDKYMKVYQQMKMYNDPNLNPVLYRKK